MGVVSFMGVAPIECKEFVLALQSKKLQNNTAFGILIINYVL